MGDEDIEIRHGVEYPSSVSDFDYSDSWLCSVSRTFSVGDGVIIDLRKRPLEVTGREHTSASHSGDSIVLTLEGNGTEYKLHIPNDNHCAPRIDWPSNDGTVYIKRISHIGGEPAILADSKASEYLVDDAMLDTDIYSGDRQPDTPTGVVIGECPSCYGNVVKESEQANCTGCELWCWMPEWNEYHGVSE